MSERPLARSSSEKLERALVAISSGVRSDMIVLSQGFCQRAVCVLNQEAVTVTALAVLAVAPG